MIVQLNDQQEYMEVCYAPSDRSSCRVCKDKIPIGQIRVSISLNNDHFSAKYWNHLQCFQLKPKYKHLEPKKQIWGLKSLKAKDQKKVIGYMNEQLDNLENGIKLNKKQSKKASKRSETVVKDAKKQVPKKSKSVPKKTVKAKKIKKKQSSGYTAAERKLFQEYCEKYQKLSSVQLKQMLGINGQPKTGAKAELVEKCADGLLLGKIPTCKECGGGKLRFNEKTGDYKCPGYMEDEDFVNCGKKFSYGTIERQKWTEV